MNARYTERIGEVEVSLLVSDDEEQWTVYTRWLKPDGTLLTAGRKTFTGENPDIQAAAFGNSILFEEWKRDPSRVRPVFAL